MKILQQAATIKPQNALIAAGFLSAILISLGLYFDYPELSALPLIVVGVLVVV